MEVKIPYGNKEITVNIPKEILAAVVQPNRVPKMYPLKILEVAFQSPIGASSFEKFLSSDTLFIVNDAARPTPTTKILEFLHERISTFEPAGFLVATGAHRAPTEEEFKLIFGPFAKKYRRKIFVHNAKKSKCVYLGRTSNGTEIWINHLVVRARRLVIIISVEPHYFAGYTGGRKSLLPGVAAYETIQQNHRLALDFRAKILALEGNPVHEDMMEVVQMLNKDIFAINAVLDRDHELYAVFGGDIYQSFKAAVNKAQEVFVVPVSERVDVIVSIALNPIDVDSYQSQKAIDNAKHVLHKGGLIILVSKCYKGIVDPTFFELFSSTSSPEEIIERARKEYKLGYHKAAKLAEILKEVEIWAVTGLPHKVIRRAFLQPFSKLQEAIDKAMVVKMVKC